MQIFNLRYGFATNSSSTHSMVFRDSEIDDDEDLFEYGWQHFTLASKATRRRYWFMTVVEALGVYHLPPKYAWAVAERLCGVSYDFSREAYVDHQSRLSIPQKVGTWRRWVTPELDERYIEDLGVFLLQEKLVILGGNDNDDESHPLSYLPHVQTTLPTDQQSIWGKKDPQGFWTVFYPYDGRKVRFRFEDNFPAPTHASTPELCDLKITDFCEKGCSFCYADSGPSGEHADPHVVDTALRALSDLGVFEVAIGGGEPTTHPELPDILKMCKDNGIVPNLATGSLDWLDGPLCEDVFKYCRAVGYSVSSADDVLCLGKKLDKAYKKASLGEWPFERVTVFNVHIVLGTVERSEFDAILEAACEIHCPVILLGFKTVGRGAHYAPVGYSWWLDAVTAQKEKGFLSVGIDTLLARESQKELKAAKISPKLYDLDEGRFSVFVDAVSQNLGPCSYAPDKMVSWKNTHIGDVLDQNFPFVGENT